MADSLQKILTSRFKKKPLAKQIMAGMVVEFANGLMKEYWGKKGHELVRVISLKSQILKIETANSIIAQELNFKKNSIIEAINQKFGSQIVKKLKIVQTSIERPVY